MAGADAMRASDGDRERVVAALQGQVGEGRLTLAEFEQRTNEAYAAKTIGDLRKLTADLPIEVFPQPQPFGGGVPWQQPFPMPGLPAWQQRGGPPVRMGRVHPLAVVGAVLMGLLVVSAALNLIGFALPVILPLFLVFAVIRSAGRGRRPGPPFR